MKNKLSDTKKTMKNNYCSFLGLATAVMVSASAFQTAAADLAPGLFGHVVAWGNNSNHETDVPANLTNIVSIAAGSHHNLAVTTDGTVVAWGYGYYGQTNVPAGLNGVVAVAAGGYHSLALKNDGTVIGWGNDGFGQIDIPANLLNVVAIDAGDFHSMALQADGTVVVWGYDSDNELMAPPGLNNVVAIAAGNTHALALINDGTVAGWGYSDGDQNVPLDLNNVVGIAAGLGHNIALKADGTVLAWGDNTYGENNVPAGLNNVAAIASGDFHGVAATSDGKVVAWGNNYYGQLNVPSTLNGVVAVSGGALHTMALSLAPVIVSQPKNQTASAGQSVSFQVGVSSSLPTTYQWQWNGLDLAGATDATLTLADSQNANAGNYSVVVSNSAGSASSAAAALNKTTITTGTFSGLFYEADHVSHNSSGFFSINVTTNRAFTGRLIVEGGIFTLSGKFASNQVAQLKINRARKLPLNLVLSLMTDQVIGTVSDGNWLASLQGNRMVFSKTNTTATAGKYALALCNFSDGILSPGGDTVGNLTIQTNGTVTLSETLSDNTAASWTTTVSKNGQIPVYISLYGGRGSVLGWITVDATTGNLGGSMSWIKTNANFGTFYRNGFTNIATAHGSRATTSTTSFNGAVTLGGGGLNALTANINFTAPVSTSTNAPTILTATLANKFTLSLNLASGMITGTVVDPTSGAKLPVKAVFVPGENAARGFFVKQYQSGSVMWQNN